MMFDPQSFLDQEIQGENSTVAVPCPAGDYTAIVDKINLRQWQKKDDPSVSGITLEVFWSIDSQEVRELLGREKVLVKQGIMLDLTEAGGIDMGKGRNVSLGKLRQALDLNNAGQAFSFNTLPGRVAKVKVTHRPDQVDPEKIYPEVTMVAKA